MGKNDLYSKYSANIYYILVFVVSVISLLFLPFLGSSVGLELSLPQTSADWIVYIASRIIVSTINVLIFHCFMMQGKLNVKDDPRYLEARDILIKTIEKEYIPISPGKWLFKQYGFKGTSIFVMSLLGCIALTQAILSYDVEAFISYLFVIFFGVVFGILQMKKAEQFWTEEYLRYAKYIQKKTEVNNGVNS